MYFSYIIIFGLYPAQDVCPKRFIPMGFGFGWRHWVPWAECHRWFQHTSLFTWEEMGRDGKNGKRWEKDGKRMGKGWETSHSWWLRWSNLAQTGYIFLVVSQIRCSWYAFFNKSGLICTMSMSNPPYQELYLSQQLTWTSSFATNKQHSLLAPGQPKII